MCIYLKLDTHGDPLRAINDFLAAVWNHGGLDGMLVPLPANHDNIVRPHIIDDPARLKVINPFKPLMTVNAAKLMPDIISKHTSEKLAGIFRPCELRALIEMTKRTKINLENFISIGVDCLGTFPATDYLWRAERKGSTDALAQEALSFARQGGIMAYRYRSACQLCISPDASGADINISVLGLPVRQTLLVGVQNAKLVEMDVLIRLTDGEASQELVNQHKRLISKLIERRNRTRERVIDGLAEILPMNINALVEQLSQCAPCQKCLESCPICETDYPQQDSNGRFLTSDVIRWLISCAGCGMCEQACPQHQPLSAIFTHIREQLAKEFDYIAGRSFNEPIPAI